LDSILDNIPDEFYNWVKETENNLKFDYNQIFEFCVEKFSEIKLETNSTKEFALMVQNTIDKKYQSILFSFYNNNTNTVAKTIWKLLEPKFEKPFKNKQLLNDL
jgi:RNA ligase